MLAEYMTAVLAGAMFACMGWGVLRIRLATTYNVVSGAVSAGD
jgi:hypothetical protein